MAHQKVVRNIAFGARLHIRLVFPPIIFLHGAAMEASSNVSAGLSAVAEVKAWFTGDTTFDFWVLRNI
jgi:hypothetical protein